MYIYFYQRTIGGFLIKNFVDLHLHSTYSNLDGFGTPEQVVTRAKEIGRDTIALTDHGSVSGLVQLKKACNKHDLKPIYGCEFYMVSSLSDMFANKERTKHHITVLASNQEGYGNLLRLASEAYRKGYYYKPTIDMAMLFDRNDGLIVLSGCWNGMMQRLLQNGNVKVAQKLADSFKEVFGDRYYLETQHFTLFENTIEDLQYISDTFGIPMVLTCDPHYLTRDQYSVQEVLHSIRDIRKFDIEKIIDECYQWPADDLLEVMSTRFPKVKCEELFSNVCDIGERCNVDMPMGGIPRFIFDDEKKTPEQILFEKCKDGITKRNLTKAGDIYRERFRKEFDMIVKKDFIDYFLIVSDMVSWAKDNNILVGPARGSSAGSLICYLLGITEVNPLLYDLVFERFIDENRSDLPDIDIDFDKERREEVKQYMIDKYGYSRVCNVATFTTFKGKNTLDDVGKVFSTPTSDIGVIKKNIIIRSDADERVNSTIEDTFALPDVKHIVERNENLYHASMLEGQLRHMGKHAAGLIVGDRDLDEIIALYERDGQALSSVEMKDASYLGLLKIDVLSINELTILNHVCNLVGMTTQDLYNISMDDEKTLKGFRSLDVGGIFQFDGHSTKNVLSQIPDVNFEQLIACVALSKPGPNNSNSTKDYLLYAKGFGKDNCFNQHVKLRNITENTHFQIIYQEQALAVIREIGNMSWADANILRGLIAKSQGEQVLESYWPTFLQGANDNGLSDSDARMIWDNIKTMGKYAFNKSHAVSYAILAFWSMYMKQHYPLEFYAGLLVKENDKDKIQHVLLEITNVGIPVYPPVLGKSGENWAIENNGLRAGLLSIDGVGEKVAKTLIDDNYLTKEDFATKKNRSVTKRTFTKLEECNAFENGDMNFFGLQSYDMLDKISKERTKLADITEHDEVGKLEIAGFVTKINNKDIIEETKAKGKPTDSIKDKHITKYAIVSLNDDTGSCLVFVDRYLYDKVNYKIANAMDKGYTVLVKGFKISNMRLIRANKFLVYDKNLVEVE